MEELRSRLAGAETVDGPADRSAATKRNSLVSNGVTGPQPAVPEKPRHRIEVQKDETRESVPATGVIVRSQLLSCWSVVSGYYAKYDLGHVLGNVSSPGADGHPAAGPQGVRRAAAGALRHHRQAAGGAAGHRGAEGQGECQRMPAGVLHWF